MPSISILCVWSDHFILTERSYLASYPLWRLLYIALNHCKLTPWLPSHTSNQTDKRWINNVLRQLRRRDLRLAIAIKDFKNNTAIQRAEDDNRSSKPLSLYKYPFLHYFFRRIFSFVESGRLHCAPYLNPKIAKKPSPQPPPSYLRNIFEVKPSSVYYNDALSSFWTPDRGVSSAGFISVDAEVKDIAGNPESRCTSRQVAQYGADHAYALLISP